MADNLLQSTFGISKSLLDQVTATTGDVKSGVVYIDSDGIIQTGTLALSGNAGTGDVKSGKTFYSNSWTRQTGTLTLSGNATTSQVLSGRTYYSNSWTKQTGTMTNRGAVTKSINPGSSYTIPAGYHNGSGKVTANTATKTYTVKLRVALGTRGSTPYASGGCEIFDSSGNSKFAGWFESESMNGGWKYQEKSVTL